MERAWCSNDGGCGDACAGGLVERGQQRAVASIGFRIALAMDVGVLARVVTGQGPGVNEPAGTVAHVRRRRFVAHREQAARDEQDCSDRRDTAGPYLQATCTSHVTSVA